MRSEKRGLFWWDWYSICSRHRDHLETCRLCLTGQWKRRASVWASGVFHRAFPRLWRWWVNRPGGLDRKFLETVFPGLRRKA